MIFDRLEFELWLLQVSSAYGAARTNRTREVDSRIFRDKVSEWVLGCDKVGPAIRFEVLKVAHAFIGSRNPVEMLLQEADSHLTILLERIFPPSQISPDKPVRKARAKKKAKAKAKSKTQTTSS